MTPTEEVDPLVASFSQLIEEHGDEAVKELATAAYSEELAKSAAPSEDVAQLADRVKTLELIVAKLVQDPASLAKAAGPGELSDQDKRAVASMAAGF